jgi:branched-chain amino acid transport system permease protein
MTAGRAQAIVTGILLCLAALLPPLLLSDYDLGVLSLVVTYMMASLAQNLLAGYAGVPSLGNVIFFATGAYVAGSLLSLASFPLAAAVVVAAVAAGVVGLVVGLPALRVSGMHLAIVTVALVFVAQDIMAQWDAEHAPSGLSVSGPGWLLQERGLYLTAVLLAALVYLATWTLLRSRTGRAILALSENPSAALAMGIDVVRYRLLAFVISGIITGLAGAVYLFYARTVTPTVFPLDLSLAFLTMMILGGRRSIGGSLLGAAIIGLLPQFLRIFPADIGPINIQQSVSGIYAVLLLVVLRFFPEGLWRVGARLTDRGDGEA